MEHVVVVVARNVHPRESFQRRRCVKGGMKLTLDIGYLISDHTRTTHIVNGLE